MKKEMKECCKANKESDYDPYHVYFCPICQEVYPPEKKENSCVALIILTIT